MKAPDKGPILMVDDDAEDRLLLSEALKRAGIEQDVRFVEDGVELLEYLRREGRFALPSSSPRPGIILLDLNMPRKNGIEVLQDIREDPDLKLLPVIALTTSNRSDDIHRMYELGVNSFVTKRGSMDELVMVLKNIWNFWYQTATLPVEGYQ
ncbi:Two-component system response regulator [Planctomycetales bacterium 10988]|nr:Two-component system response regulator [Planctomycetales bacterium 10988]